jgi:hypothetical protein
MCVWGSSYGDPQGRPRLAGRSWIRRRVRFYGAFMVAVDEWSGVTRGDEVLVEAAAGMADAGTGKPCTLTTRYQPRR